MRSRSSFAYKTKRFDPKERRGGEPESMERVLHKLLGGKKDVARQIARYKFVTHWKEIVGEAIARNTSPECLRNHALVIRVTSSAWAQELSFHKQLILKRLKKFIPDDEMVKDVVFYVAGTTGGSGKQ